MRPGATFDTLDESSSLTTTMPLLVVLGVVGYIVAGQFINLAADLMVRGVRKRKTV